MTKTKAKAELVAALDALEARLPVLIAATDPASIMDAMDAFAGEAEMVEYNIDEADRPYFSNRVQGMLRDAGLIPGDDEPYDVPVSGG